MPQVRINVRDAEDKPARAAITATLVAGDARSPVYRDGAKVLVKKVTAHAGADGSVTLELPPTTDLIPAGTHYKVEVLVQGERRPKISLIQVPDGGGPFDLEDILVDPPSPIAGAPLSIHRETVADHLDWSDGAPNVGQVPMWDGERYAPADTVATDLEVSAAILAESTARIESDADLATAIADHQGRTDNPHDVTAEQVGADLAGSAADVQANLDAAITKDFLDTLGIDAATLQGASLAQVQATIMAAIVDSAPGTLDTLNELAAALGDDPNFATTIAGLIGNETAARQAHEADDNNPHGVTKDQVGLDNVDNTADVDKPVSVAAAQILATKQPITGERQRIPCVIPTSDGDQRLTHPSVVEAPEGWNGYRYWMAFTPFPDAARENPHVVASHNGIEWEVPPGATNPVVPLGEIVAQGHGHNSDTHLVLLSNGTMRLYYRPNSGASGERLYCKESTDGVTWGPPQLVLSAGGTGTRYISPAVVQEADGTFSMWTVNRDATPKVQRRTSANGIDGWSAAADCTIPSLPKSQTPWHLDVKRVDSRYFMLLNSTDAFRLFGFESNDGLAFTGQTYPVVGRGKVGGYDDGGHYRSAMLPIPGDAQNPLRWKVWVATRRLADANEWVVILHDNVDLTKAATKGQRGTAARAGGRTIPRFPSFATHSMGAGNQRATALWVPPRSEVEAILCEITTAVAASVVRLNLYRDRGDSFPGALIASVPIDSTANGVRKGAIAPGVLEEGLYWGALHVDTAASAVGYRGCGSANLDEIVPHADPSSAAITAGINTYLQQGIPAGAAPVNFDAAAAFGAGAPWIALQHTSESGWK